MIKVLQQLVVQASASHADIITLPEGVSVEALVDAIWMYDLMMNASGGVNEENSQQQQSLALLVRKLSCTYDAFKKACLLTLEPGLLQAAGLIQDAGLFSKRLVRTNTSMFYK